MTPSMLRHLWSVVEMTQSHLLLKLDDDSLVQCLIRQLSTHNTINGDEVTVLSDYIQSRVALIRDLAQDRQTIQQVR